GDADNLFDFGHSAAAYAAGTCLARSDAVNAAPARRAAQPCSHTASQAAVNGSCPAATRAATIPASTSPVPPAESQAVGDGASTVRPSGAAITVSGPLATTVAPIAFASARALATLPSLAIPNASS